MLILELNQFEAEDWAHMKRVVAHGFKPAPDLDYVDNRSANMRVIVYTKQDDCNEQRHVAFGDLPLDEMNLDEAISYLQAQGYSIAHTLEGWCIVKDGLPHCVWNSEGVISHARLLQDYDFITTFYGVGK